MPVCILTCEVRNDNPDSWHISILGLDSKSASEMRSRHTDLDPGPESAFEMCLFHYEVRPIVCRFLVRPEINHIFEAMENRPEAILKLAAKYINTLESLNYKLKSTTPSSSEGKSKWTFTLRSSPSKSPLSKLKRSSK
ncbi:uncharacterized protein LOC110861966 [Folsomia candida]|uniref:Uncharacterized protein n=1 Tax=Folsomia candida TaxID=158441 RepID=A0A226D0N3_FOLCA|nr:uncharacterized protein LOC110861966 [Folsomia candida]OXA38277.1 hypothetical protein Fcan01_26957 [Folsomia candida]